MGDWWEDTRSMEHILEDFERKKCQACLKMVTDKVKALTFLLFENFMHKYNVLIKYITPFLQFLPTPPNPDCFASLLLTFSKANGISKALDR